LNDQHLAMQEAWHSPSQQRERPRWAWRTTGCWNGFPAIGLEGYPSECWLVPSPHNDSRRWSNSRQPAGVFWFSVKMRMNLTEEGFRPPGGDFQGMRIYRSDRCLDAWAAKKFTPPITDHRPRWVRQAIPRHGCVPAEPASVSPDIDLIGYAASKLEEDCGSARWAFAACARRFLADTSFWSRAAWISAWRPSNMACGVT